MSARRLDDFLIFALAFFLQNVATDSFTFYLNSINYEKINGPFIRSNTTVTECAK